MILSTLLAAGLSAALAAAAPHHPSKRQSSSSGNTTLVSDIPTISNYWGQIRPYADNSQTYFGVEYNGLPAGCGIEQVHQLHRHGARYPSECFTSFNLHKLMNLQPAVLMTGPTTRLSQPRSRTTLLKVETLLGHCPSCLHGATSWAADF